MRAHKIKVARGEKDDPRDVPRMPRRCQGYVRIPCPFHARHWSLTGTLGHSDFYAMCDPHFRYYNLMTRRWRKSDLVAPDIETVHTDVPKLTGYLHRAKNLLYLTQVFAEQETEYQLFGLAHETVHLVLRRDFGGATALALDILYKRSLRCLRGHSMMTWELSALSAQSIPAPAQSAPVPEASGRRVMPRTLK